MSAARRGRRCRAAVSLLLSLCANAAAACTANPYVGDTSDAACTDPDIQSAIDNACPNATIVITGQTYTGQALTLGNKSLTLIANGGQCGASPPSTNVPLAKLSGQDGHSVFWITGTSNVTLQNLEITGGCSGSQCSGGGGGGGGVEFQGSGSLTLNTVTLDHNKADYGAGVDVSTSGGNVALTVGANTLISYNTASKGGGGIHLVGTGDGQATLVMAQPAFVESNIAPYGGGLNIVGDAVAYIGSPGLFGLGAIYGNNADYGGGLAATADGDGGPLVYLYSTDANNPITIGGNAATQQGGAIYTSVDGFNSTDVSLWDYQLTGNVAAEGPAIYGQSQLIQPTAGFGAPSVTASNFFLNTTDKFYDGRSSALPSGAVHCTPQLTCNSISNNVAQDGSGNPTSGSTIFLEEQGVLHADRLIMRGNQGRSAVLGYDSDDLELQDCLLADNSYTAPLIQNEGNDVASAILLNDVIATTISNCTLANNKLGDDSTNTYLLVIYNYAGTFSLQNSIIDQGGYNPEYSSGDPASTSLHNNLARYGFPYYPGVQDLVSGAPLYVNAAAGDYHLLPTSPGVDFAPAAGGTDLAGNPRDVDLPDVPNVFGARDLGAYETQNEAGFTGACGSDNGQALPSPPTNLCSAGQPGLIYTNTSAGWNWTCAGSDGSTAAQCSATVATQILGLDLTGLPPAGTVGIPYSGSVVITNINGAVSLSGSASADISGLPPGLSLSGPCDPAYLSPGNYVTCPVSGTPTTAGKYPVRVTAADPDYRYSIELDQNIVITMTTVAPTTTTLNAAPNPAAVGQVVTFNVSVDPTSTPAPSGTATVSGDGMSCVATLTAVNTTTSAGSCVLTFAAAGSYVMTASYSGDANYAASSATLDVVVDATIASATVAGAPMIDRWALYGLIAGLCGSALYRQRRRLR